MIHPHWWLMVKKTHGQLWQRCRLCGKRRIKSRFTSGYQPIDRVWIETGVEMGIGEPPRSRHAFRPPATETFIDGIGWIPDRDC